MELEDIGFAIGYRSAGKENSKCSYCATVFYPTLEEAIDAYITQLESSVKREKLSVEEAQKKVDAFKQARSNLIQGKVVEVGDKE